MTHATPAALYAKTADRKWECDANMPDERPEQVKCDKMMSPLLVADKIRPDQTRPDQTRPDKTRLDRTIPDQTKQYQTR